MLNIFFKEHAFLNSALGLFSTRHRTVVGDIGWELQEHLGSNILLVDFWRCLSDVFCCYYGKNIYVISTYCEALNRNSILKLMAFRF